MCWDRLIALEQETTCQESAPMEASRHPFPAAIPTPETHEPMPELVAVEAA